MTLSRDDRRFSRWSGSYPTRAQPPIYVTKAWGGQTGLNLEGALIHVLRTLWLWHEEATGEPCPYQWPEQWGPPSYHQLHRISFEPTRASPTHTHTHSIAVVLPM